MPPGRRKYNDKLYDYHSLQRYFNLFLFNLQCDVFWGGGGGGSPPPQEHQLECGALVKETGEGGSPPLLPSPYLAIPHMVAALDGIPQKQVGHFMLPTKSCMNTSFTLCPNPLYHYSSRQVYAIFCRRQKVCDLLLVDFTQPQPSFSLKPNPYSFKSFFAFQIKDGDYKQRECACTVGQLQRSGRKQF